MLRDGLNTLYNGPLTETIRSIRAVFKVGTEFSLEFNKERAERVGSGTPVSCWHKVARKQ
jgi:hypothetical protein